VDAQPNQADACAESVPPTALGDVLGYTTTHAC
jgi:hypothetical protein